MTEESVKIGDVVEVLLSMSLGVRECRIINGPDEDNFIVVKDLLGLELYRVPAEALWWWR